MPESPAVEARDGESRELEVRTAAAADVVPTLRTLAADLAMRLDFDLDAVDDLRMTVDEACSLLVPASSDGVLHCGFRWGPGRVAVTVTVLAAEPGPADENSLGWQLLVALATSARRVVTECDGGYLIRIELARESVAVAT